MEKIIKIKYVLPIAIIAIVLIQCIYGLFIYSSFGTWDERGTFGDMFGAVNALFSGLAFAGIVFTIIIQLLSIDIQKKELEKTVDAQRKSELILKRQLETSEFSTRFSAEVYLLDYYDRKILELTKSNQDEKAKQKKNDLINRKSEIEDLIKKSHERYKKIFS